MATDIFPPHALAVTGLGMVSPLGWGAVSSCAAARAGILRLSPLENSYERDPKTGDAEPILGHAATDCTAGFTGAGRLIRLGVAALTDLKRSIDGGSLHKASLILNLASGLYFKVASPGKLGSEHDDTGAPSPNALHQPQEQSILTRLTRLAELPIPPAQCQVFRGDQPGFLHALEAAAQQLRLRTFSRCIIGGIDSYVDQPLVQALDTLRILKTPSRPQGALPGECAAFLQVELLESARRRGAQIGCVLAGRAIHREEHDRFSGSPSQGEALAESIVHVWQELASWQRPGLLIGNLTGDERRAYDWGFALSRLQGHGFPTNLPLWHTGLSFGEIGAATVPTAIALAARAFARGYARTPSVVIWVSSDSSERGALHVLAPPS